VRTVCLTEKTIVLYRGWCERFIEHCRKHQLPPRTALTFSQVIRFMHHYARRHDVDVETAKSLRTVLHRWAEALCTPEPAASAVPDQPRTSPAGVEPAAM
jgi:hypothetical protein